jgi:hypothetical protein
LSSVYYVLNSLMEGYICKIKWEEKQKKRPQKNIPFLLYTSHSLSLSRVKKRTRADKVVNVTVEL